MDIWFSISIHDPVKSSGEISQACHLGHAAMMHTLSCDNFLQSPDMLEQRKVPSPHLTHEIIR